MLLANGKHIGAKKQFVWNFWSGLDLDFALALNKQNLICALD